MEMEMKIAGKNLRIRMKGREEVGRFKGEGFGVAES